MAASAAPIFAGSLYLWPGRGLYVGRTADTASHSHHALQICVGIEDDIEVDLATGDAYDIARRRCIVITPDRGHRLRGSAGRVALVYVDPESDAAHAILTRGASAESIDPSSFLASQGDTDGLAAGQAQEICERIIAGLSGTMPRARAIDNRVDRAIAAMRESLDAAPRIGELAAGADLSIGRFGHLFREVTGIPVRRYQLWLRLVAALAELTSGCSLTDAAHAAGFADSAHMTRTFRRMFGIAPSALHRHSRFVQAHQ